jgi:hypothetical protein
MSRSCHNALTARHEPSFSASLSSSRPPCRGEKRRPRVARDQAQHVGHDDAVERRGPLGRQGLDRAGAELRAGILTYRLVRPGDLALIGIDADDAPLRVTVE